MTNREILSPGACDVTATPCALVSSARDSVAAADPIAVAPLAKNESPVAVRRSASTVESRIFPLHLAPIDSFFLADDSREYPMLSAIEVMFSGELRQEPFREAVQWAVARHPLLRAVIRPAKRHRLCWIVAPDVEPVVDWGTRFAPIPDPWSLATDFSRQCGLRMWVRVGGGTSRLVLSVHHACTDGTGVYRFLGDLLGAYAARCGNDPQPAESLDVDPRLLRGRLRKMASQVIATAKAYDLLKIALHEAWQLAGSRVTPLALHRTPVPSLTESPTVDPACQGQTEWMCWSEFSAEEHQTLRQVASSQGAMLNDLLIAGMFRAISRWNEAHGARPASDGHYRIMMPFDMRTQADYAMPAANMTAYTFLTRRAAECRQLSNLLQSVREETGRIKAGREGTAFMDAITAAAYQPTLLRWLLRWNRCLATVTLSNIGDPTKRFTCSFPRSRGRLVCGDVTLEQIVGVPPLRRQMRATLAIFSYLRKLTVCLRCDPHHFSMPETSAFLGVYAATLRDQLPLGGTETRTREKASDRDSVRRSA